LWREKEKSTFPLVTTKILHYWFHKNIPLRLDKHMSYVPCFSFVAYSWTIATSRLHGVHDTGRNMGVNIDKNMENFLLCTVEGTKSFTQLPTILTKVRYSCFCAGHEVIWKEWMYNATHS
jgi:hypothetical protein